MRQHTTEGAWSNTNIINAYSESIAYDANGNILKYLRKGADVAGMPMGMDSLTYQYNRDGAGSLLYNKLNHIRDTVSSSRYTVDIDNQSTGNYVYDKIGNLIKDVAEGLDTVRWTAYGKINRIKKNAAAIAINYGYDAAGNRTLKQVLNHDTTINTFYVRNAQGNVLSVYENSSISSGVKWTEQHLYGSSRLGLWQWNTLTPALPPVVKNK